MSAPHILSPRLSVNIDHVATLRQARQAKDPKPVGAAQLAELGGAAQITVHLREDRRHIQDQDLALLRATVSTLNLEMAATDDMLRVAFDTKPDMVTLVPERRQELTTEGGLDVAAGRDHLKRLVSELAAADIFVSLFVDPNLEQVQMAKRVGAHAVELHTGRYCDATNANEREEERSRLVDAAKTAVRSKLKCFAGRGVDYQNVGDIAAITEFEELHVGHAIIARSIFVGMSAAVREMRDLAWAARRDALLRA